MTSILIADDEPLVRAGLRTVIKTDQSLDVVAEAATGRRAVDLTRRYRPAVVLMDIRMPDLDGLSASEEIQRLFPEQKIIVFTTFAEPDYIDRAVEAGVNGFLTKSGDPRDLLHGIHAVLGGGSCLAPTVASHVLTALRRRHPTRTSNALAAVATLAPRERDVLMHVAAGRSNTEIAARLFLSHGTVKAYISSILTRLGVRNRVEASTIAWEAARHDPSLAQSHNPNEG